MHEAVSMARPGSNFEGIYTSPQISRSGSFSELGLTLLPSTGDRSDSGQIESHGCAAVGLRLGQYECPRPFEDGCGQITYPSPTPSPGSFQSEGSNDVPKHPGHLSNNDHRKQALLASTNKPTAPLFVPLRPFDRHGRPNSSSVTPTYITAPLQYRPSAPHLHILVSTGTTLAASAQIDHLKERNKHLTMERDRYYHLSKPATRRADDLKSEQIRQLRSELTDATVRNDRLQWALHNQNQANAVQIQRLHAELRDLTEHNSRTQCALRQETTRAHYTQALAAQQTDASGEVMVAHNRLILCNPSTTLAPQSLPPTSYTTLYRVEDDISPRQVSFVDLTLPKSSQQSQQGGAQRSRVPSTTAVHSTLNHTPVPTSCTSTSTTVTPIPPPILVGEHSSKRPRTGSNNEKHSSGEPPSKRQHATSHTQESQPHQQQQQQQHSMFNSSQFHDIEARVRSALKGKTAAYAWLNGKEREEVEEMAGRRVAKGVQVAHEVGPMNSADTAAEDELSASEIAEFDKALQEAWDEAGDVGLEGDDDGDSHSLFDDLLVADG